MTCRTFKTLAFAGAVSSLASLVGLVPAAAQANIPYAGTITGTCLVTAGTSGVLAANAGNDVLSSKNGGTAGTATVNTNAGNYEVSIVPPTDWMAQASTFNGSTSFLATYSLSGATSSSETSSATATAVNSGSTLVTADLTGTSNSGAFDAGAYSAIVTVRCEATGGNT